MGTGGSSLVSLYLGAREKEKAHCAASTGFFLALGLGGVIAAGGLLALEPLMRLLGSTETILPEAEAYAVPILLAAPFHCSSLALAQCLRAEGKSKESMAGQLAGGLLNIVLDPLFIYTLGMGIRGAGAATALSQVMVWACLLYTSSHAGLAGPWRRGAHQHALHAGRQLAVAHGPRRTDGRSGGRYSGFDEAVRPLLIRTFSFSFFLKRKRVPHG